MGEKEITIMAPVSQEEFIEEMEGCIKEGTPTLYPPELKKIWEPKVVASKMIKDEFVVGERRYPIKEKEFEELSIKAGFQAKK